MKAISAPLMAHLQQPVTTLATCWRIERTDGVTLGFTTLDEDLIIDGITYRSIAGFSRSAVAAGSTGSVDNAQVLGYFADDGVSEDDLKRRKFDYAQVFLFAVNWADLTQGICRLRRGWLGEAVRTASGNFEAELRGLTQALTQEIGNVFSPLCRADLGDALCKVPIKPAPWAPNTAYGLGTFVQARTQSSDALIEAIFEVTQAGTSLPVEPAWNTTINGSVADGTTLVWTSRQPWRRIATVQPGGVLDSQHFVSSSLAIGSNLGGRSNQATIAVGNNVSAGTIVEVTDGVVTVSHVFPFDTRGGNVLFQLLQMIGQGITAGGLKMQVRQTGVVIYLTNNSGRVGHISKTGDSLGAIIIGQFEDPPLDGGTVTWLSGANAGTSMEMKSYNPNSGIVELWLAMGFPIAEGDRFFYYQGCDKRRDTCKNVFNNILNFRGEPDMPGMDALLSYPNAV